MPKNSAAISRLIEAFTLSINGFPTNEISAPAFLYTSNSNGKIATILSAILATSLALPLRHAQAEGGIYENTGIFIFLASLARRQLKSG